MINVMYCLETEETHYTKEGKLIVVPRKDEKLKIVRLVFQVKEIIYCDNWDFIYIILNKTSLNKKLDEELKELGFIENTIHFFTEKDL